MVSAALPLKDGSQTSRVSANFPPFPEHLFNNKANAQNNEGWFNLHTQPVSVQYCGDAAFPLRLIYLGFYMFTGRLFSISIDTITLRSIKIICCA